MHSVVKGLLKFTLHDIMAILATGVVRDAGNHLDALT